MANVKNFGLIGVADNVQYGKAGPRLKHVSGDFSLRNAADSANAALTLAGLTSSAGNVTLTTGNVVLSSSAGNVSIGGDTTLSRQQAGVFQLDGTAAVRVPVGTVGQRPGTALAGMFRFNDDSDQMEYYNGTDWETLATGTSAVASVSGTANRITISGTSTDPVVDIASTYVGQTSITTLGTVTTGTWNGTTIAVANGGTGATTLTTNGVLFGNGTSAIGATAAGTQYQVLQAGVGGVPEFGAVALNQSAAVTGVLAPANGGTGVANDPTDTITLGGAISTAGAFTTSGANPLTLTTTGATNVTLTTSGTLLTTGDTSNYVSEITSSGGTITVSSPTGSVNIDLPAVGTPVTGSFVKITTDTQGRVSATTPVVQADITGLVDAVYVNVAGDTMTGDLNMGSFYVTMNNAPVDDTDAANKAYVDAVAAGLTWKTAVKAASTGDLTLSGEQTVDGVALVTGDRVLVKDQSAPADNGIYIVDSGAWTRSTDADTPAELDSATVFVQQGTANADTGWTQTATIVTVGTTAQTWVQFSGSSTYTWGTGLANSGNTVFVNLGAGITELPSDEVGIHLYDSANNPLILTLDGTTRSTDTAAALGLLLDGSSLSKSSAGLRVAAGGVDLTTMVTGVLPAANGGTGVSNSNTITLGGNIVTAGAFTTSGANPLTLTTTGATNVTLPTSGTLATVAGTVASFQTDLAGLTPSTATTGAVTLSGTLGVASGGTGLTSVTANYVPYGAGTSPLATSSAFQFNGTDTLTVGTATLQGGATDVTITATGLNGDINLVPNGTGQVVVGPAGAGVISSDAGQTLTVTGATGLTLGATAGDVTISLANNTTSKVTVSGPSAADYATGLANEDLVNKYYVDTVAGSAAGDVKAYKATVSLAADGTTPIGSALPAGATVLSVKVNVTSVDTGATLEVGVSGDADAYMTTAENDPQTVGLYVAECMVVNSGVQVIATVANSAAAGSADVVVTYQIAN